MNKIKTISAPKAIAIMRDLRKTMPESHFTLMHLTYNRQTKETNGLRHIERCKLRASLPKEAFSTDRDHYLTYTDLDTNDAKMCFKKLIRFVAFPPDYELMKVTWFDK